MTTEANTEADVTHPVGTLLKQQDSQSAVENEHTNKY